MQPYQPCSKWESPSCRWWWQYWVILGLLVTFYVAPSLLFLSGCTMPQKGKAKVEAGPFMGRFKWKSPCSPKPDEANPPPPSMTEQEQARKVLERAEKAKPRQLPPPPTPADTTGTPPPTTPAAGDHTHPSAPDSPQGAAPTSDPTKVGPVGPPM